MRSRRTVGEWWQEAQRRLEQAGVADAQAEASWLLRLVLRVDAGWLHVHRDQVMEAGQSEALASALERRLRREPLAYIVGFEEFYGLRFRSDPRALIPRPETELLVDVALELLRGQAGPVVADIGTGCGAIGLSLARTIPTARVVCTEISAPALELARQNAVELGVADRVDFRWGPDLDPLRELALESGLHVLLSNPPYVRSAEVDSLEPEIAHHEPRVALDGGPDGLDFYRRVVPRCLQFARPGGAAAFEVGAGQAEAVAELWRRSDPTADIRIRRDLAGVPRVVLAVKSS